MTILLFCKTENTNNMQEKSCVHKFVQNSPLNLETPYSEYLRTVLFFVVLG